MGKITGINSTPIKDSEIASYSYSQNTTQIINAANTGNVFMFAGNTIPTGYLLCDGSEVSRTTYNNLFIAIGTTYGVGNGSTTFNLPNLKGKMPVGVKSGGVVSALGAIGGSINHTHSITNHQHTQSHSHDCSHYHSMNHQHYIGHTHEMTDHNHTMSNHQHWVPAHAHGYYVSSAAEGGSGHRHTYTVRDATNTGNTDIRGGSAGSSLFTYSDELVVTGFSVGGQAGSGNAGDTGFASDWASHTTTSTSSGARSNTYAAYTDNVTIYTGTESLTSSVDTTNTGNMVSAVNTGPSNPPFLTVNFIIKA